MRSIITLFALLLMLPSVWASTIELPITKAYVRASLPGQKITTAFFTVKNPLNQPLVLTAIHSNVAETVELHSHTMVNGQMQMRKMSNFSIPAHGDAVFTPGEQHIMLLGLKQPLQENTTVKLEMCFDELCSIITLPVISVLNEGKVMPAAEHHHH